MIFISNKFTVPQHMKEYFSNNKALPFKNVPTLIAGMEHEMEWTMEWNGRMECGM